MNKGYSVPDSMNIRKHRFSQKERDIDIPDGDPALGESLFAKICAGCHSQESDGPMGPSLEKIYLQRAGSRPGYEGYSRELISKRFVWTRHRLWDYVTDPLGYIPETTMIFDGIKDPYEMSCIIEYLVALKRGDGFKPNKLNSNLTNSTRGAYKKTKT